MTRNDDIPTKLCLFSPQGNLTFAAQWQLYSRAKSHQGSSFVTSTELGCTIEVATWPILPANLIALFHLHFRGIVLQQARQKRVFSVTAS